jgi:hypothetical protein
MLIPTLATFHFQAESPACLYNKDASTGRYNALPDCTSVSAQYRNATTSRGVAAALGDKSTLLATESYIACVEFDRSRTNFFFLMRLRLRCIKRNRSLERRKLSKRMKREGSRFSGGTRLPDRRVGVSE